MGYQGESRYQSSKKRYSKMTDEERKIKSKKQYERLMKDPERKSKFQERVNLYRKEIREINIERGLCSSCGKEKETLKFIQCHKCREYQRNCCKKRQLKKQSQGKNKVT